MPDSYEDFSEKLSEFIDNVDTIQIDIMDKHFVPSISWPYNSPNDKNWER